ncbi:MAG: iron-sulfur cluster assembly accessory protein [Methanobacteriota archaeon]|nr:MAG: iron-sulfur cluster assembly accessory protein [Euryarchaeota archaeon]
MQGQETAPHAPLALSPAAVDRIRTLKRKFERPDGGLRLRIIAGGCSGMQYRIDFAETARQTDVIVDADDVKVFIDPKSLTYVKGSSLDYWEDLLGGGFKVVNPNAKSACSCGVSFTV